MNCQIMSKIPLQYAVDLSDEHFFLPLERKNKENEKDESDEE